MARDLIDDNIWDDYRTIIDAQLAEAHGDHAAALAGYRAVCESQILTAAGPRHAPPSAPPGACSPSTARPRRPRRPRWPPALLARWGGWRTAELDRVRDRLGLTPAPDARTVTGAAALTPREREVALLIADGLTNAELARRLYISPKTAAVHVSNILHKLGVTSRTQVAAEVTKAADPARLAIAPAATTAGAPSVPRGLGAGTRWARPARRYGERGSRGAVLRARPRWFAASRRRHAWSRQRPGAWRGAGRVRPARDVTPGSAAGGPHPVGSALRRPLPTGPRRRSLARQPLVRCLWERLKRQRWRRSFWRRRCSVLPDLTAPRARPACGTRASLP